MAWSVISILVTAAAVTLVAVLISRRQSRERTRRLRALIDVAGSVLTPTPSGQAPPGTGDEIDTLSRTLRTVAGEVRDVIDGLKIEASQRDAILSSMGEGVLVVDNQLRVIFSNEAILRAVGIRRPIGDRVPLLELVRDSEVLTMLSGVVRTGTASKRLLRVGAASGRSFEIHAAPLESGAERGAIAIFHDITGLERLEQVRKDFVANVSHEMRTPLASIIAYSDTLLEGALEEQQVNRKFVDVIRSNAIRLTNIADDLLMLSDLESGATPGEAARIAVHDVLDSVIKTVEPEAGAKNVTIFGSEPQELFVLGHRFRLEQALLNLFANAVKFNRPGGEVRAQLLQDGDGSVRIVVSDTGIGIPSEDLPRIFERFYRVDKGRSREVGGTGLGLSIVKHVVEGMNGKIDVESHLGKGSTFTVTLPAAPADVIRL